MKVLVYGGNGWIGEQFVEILQSSQIDYIIGNARVDNNDDLIAEIENISPTHIISFIGRTHGKIGDKIYPTIDYLEEKGKLLENVRDNLYSPLLLCEICRNKNISEAFLERHLNHINWYSICQNINISEQFFERHLNMVNWNSLCVSKMSEEFFERHLDMVNWYWLSDNRHLSQEFFERHLDQVHWDFLSLNTNISEEFFERHLDRVNWEYLSYNNKLSEGFFERHLNMVDWVNLSINNNISLEFILKNCNNTNKFINTNVLYKVNIDNIKNKYKNNLWMTLI
jgi:hypothetical protein